MINYNSCIDTFITRTQNTSPTYSVLKKPLKTRPKFQYFHESTQHTEDLVPPILTCKKKPLNQSPRRTVNINLKIPNVESRFSKNSSVVDRHKFHSLSVDYPKAPIVSSKHRYKQLPTISPMLFCNQNMPRDASVLQINNTKSENRSKSLIRNSSLAPTSAIFHKILNFQGYIEKTYKKMYEEIDIAQKGFLTVDDFINLVMFIDLINSKNAENFELVKAKAEDIFNLFASVSANKVTRKDFYAICSLYEQFKCTDEVMNLLDLDVCELIRKKVSENCEIFKCYAKNGRIKLKDLHNILKCLYMNDLQLVEGMLYLEVIDLSCFLRFLPLFSWMHENVIKSLDFHN